MLRVSVNSRLMSAGSPVAGRRRLNRLARSGCEAGRWAAPGHGRHARVREAVGRVAAAPMPGSSSFATELDRGNGLQRLCHGDYRPSFARDRRHRPGRRAILVRLEAGRR